MLWGHQRLWKAIFAANLGGQHKQQATAITDPTCAGCTYAVLVLIVFVQYSCEVMGTKPHGNSTLWYKTCRLFEDGQIGDTGIGKSILDSWRGNLSHLQIVGDRQTWYD